MLQGALNDNAARPAAIVERLEARLGGLRGQHVGMLGLSFKPHTDDLRDSPSLALVGALLARGAIVTAHDPVVRRRATDHVAGLARAASAEDACRGADLVVLATEWQAYLELDWGRLARMARRAVLFDGRRALDPETLRAAGWLLLGIGRAEGWAPVTPVVATPRASRQPLPVQPRPIGAAPFSQVARHARP